MRKLPLFLLVFVLLCSLCSCQSPEPERFAPYTVTRAGQEFLIDSQNNTITCNGVTYRYEISGGANSDITVTYPDGSTYWRSYHDHGWAGGWSDDYVEGKYVSGDLLLDLVGGGHSSPKKNENDISPLLALLIIAVGIFNMAKPESAWYMEYGWRYKDAEPSDLALTVNRFAGGFAIFIGLIFLIS